MNPKNDPRPVAARIVERERVVFQSLGSGTRLADRRLVENPTRVVAGHVGKLPGVVGPPVQRIGVPGDLRKALWLDPPDLDRLRLLVVTGGVGHLQEAPAVNHRRRRRFAGQLLDVGDQPLVVGDPRQRIADDHIAHQRPARGSDHVQETRHHRHHDDHQRHTQRHRGHGDKGNHPRCEVAVGEEGVVHEDRTLSTLTTGTPLPRVYRREGPTDSSSPELDSLSSAVADGCRRQSIRVLTWWVHERRAS